MLALAVSIDDAREARPAASGRKARERWGVDTWATLLRRSCCSRCEGRCARTGEIVDAQRKADLLKEIAAKEREKKQE